MIFSGAKCNYNSCTDFTPWNVRIENVDKIYRYSVKAVRNNYYLLYCIMKKWKYVWSAEYMTFQTPF